MIGATSTVTLNTNIPVELRIDNSSPVMLMCDAFCSAIVTESVTAARNPLVFDVAMENARDATRRDESFRQEIVRRLTAIDKIDLLKKIVE